MIGEVNARERKPPSITMPALASAKSGTIDVARPRVVQLLKTLVRRGRGLSSARGVTRELRRSAARGTRGSARSRARGSDAARGYANASRPIARPMTTGSTPDSSSADPGAGAEHEVDEADGCTRRPRTTSTAAKKTQQRRAVRDPDRLA